MTTLDSLDPDALCIAIPAVIAADADAIDTACRTLAADGYQLRETCEPIGLLRMYTLTGPARNPTPAQLAAQAGLPRPLSQRELDVLRLVCDGMSNPEIGDRLGIERCTVKTHVARISRVLGAVDRANAVYLALTHGFLEWDAS